MSVSTTPVPNIVFDRYLPILKPSEVKVLFAIIRQTVGSDDQEDKKWFTRKRLATLTGYSQRAVTAAVTSLLERQLIRVTSHNGEPSKRRGLGRVYFEVVYPEEQASQEEASEPEAPPKPSLSSISIRPPISQSAGKSHLQRSFPMFQWIARELQTYGSFKDWMIVVEAIRTTEEGYAVIKHTDRLDYQRRFIPQGFPPLTSDIPYDYWNKLYQEYQRHLSN